MKSYVKNANVFYACTLAAMANLEYKMKQIFFILIISIILSNCKQSTDPNNSSKLIFKYISSENGLILREKPSINSKKLFVIPYKDKINVISTTNIPLSLHDNILNTTINGNWVKVEYKQLSGYVFDGYLSETIPTYSDNISIFVKRPILNKFFKYNNSKELLNIIILELGQPNSIKESDTNYLNNNAIDKLVSLEYGKNDINLYKNTNNNTFHLFSYLFLNNDIPLNLNVKIGMNIDEIKNIFGEPRIIDNNCYKYNYYYKSKTDNSEANESNDELFLYFKNSKLDKIIIEIFYP